MKDLIPKEGATGWLDTWMVSSHTKNLDCAYKWLAYDLDAEGAGRAGDLLR